MDYVLVAVQKYKEVFSILGQMGLSDRILKSDIFSIPNLDLDEYLKLRKSRPSILANACMGDLS